LQQVFRIRPYCKSDLSLQSNVVQLGLVKLGIAAAHSWNTMSFWAIASFH
jgi:hypothetical protein